MTSAEFTNTVLYPHPVLASDDDAEYIRVTIARLPSLYDAFFHDVTMMAVAEEQLRFSRQGGVNAFGVNYNNNYNSGPYQRGPNSNMMSPPTLMSSTAINDYATGGPMGTAPLPLGGDTGTIATNINAAGEPVIDFEMKARYDVDRYRLSAENLFAEIQRHMKMVSSIPAGSLRNAIDGSENVELRQVLTKLAYLWSGDVIRVNEKAANSWSKTVQKMGEDAVRLLETTHIEFPYRAQVKRRLITPTSLTVVILQPILFVSTVATIVAAVGFTTAGVPQHVTNYCVCICGAVSLLSMMVVLSAYQMSMEGLRDLFETVFVSKFSGVEARAQAAIDELDQRQKLNEQMQQLAYVNASKKRNSASAQNPLLGPITDLLGGAGGVGGGSGSPVQISGQAALAAARGAYYPISFAGSTAFLDSRFIDAQLVMIGFDQSFKVTMWNVAAEAATGFLESEAVGKPLSDLLETPDLELTDLVSQNSNVGVIRILLKAFATNSIPMYTVVAPIINERTVLAGQSLAAAAAGSGPMSPYSHVGSPATNNNNINTAGGSGSGVGGGGGMMDSPTVAAAQQRTPLGYVLICATGRDNLQDSKVYINNYWRFQIAHSLQSTIASGTFSPKESSALTTLSEFVRKGSAKALENTAYSMVFEWEWTTAEQILARSLNSHMTRCTVRPPDRHFPSSICVNMGVVAIIDEIVGKVIRSAKCHVELDLIQERTSKVSVFVAIIKLIIDNNGEGGASEVSNQSIVSQAQHGGGPGSRFRNSRLLSTSSISGANILSTKFGALSLAAPTSGSQLLATGGNAPNSPTDVSINAPVAFSQTLEALPAPKQMETTLGNGSYNNNLNANNSSNTVTTSGHGSSGSALSGGGKRVIANGSLNIAHNAWSAADTSVLQTDLGVDEAPVAIRGTEDEPNLREVTSNEPPAPVSTASLGNNTTLGDDSLHLKAPGSNSTSNVVSPTSPRSPHQGPPTGSLGGSGHNNNPNPEVISSGNNSNGSGHVVTSGNASHAAGNVVNVPPTSSLPPQKPPSSAKGLSSSKTSYSAPFANSLPMAFPPPTFSTSSGNILSPPLPPPPPPTIIPPPLQYSTKAFNPTDILDPQGKVSGLLTSMLGMVKFLNENTTVQILVPCQTAQQQYGAVSIGADGSSSDPNNFGTSTSAVPQNGVAGGGSSLTTIPTASNNPNSGGNEDFAVSTIYGTQGIALPYGQPPISSTVNVMTMIGNLVDQHNLSMVLLKTMFVSLTNIREAKDLEKKLKANPCEVDVVVADKATLHDARTLIAEYHRSKIGTAQSQSVVYLVPLLENGAAVGTGTPYVFRTPIDRNAINATMLEIGHLVSTRKQQQEQREEQERILASRQDSPWTRGKLLGRGAFGAVYEAISDLTGGKMAVKMFYFKKDDVNAEQTINIMLREIKIMCELNHPNIVHYFYCERQQNSLNLFMEICDGSLADLVMGVTAGGGSKKVPTVADATSPEELRIAKAIANLTVNSIIGQVAKALVYLHDRGITHRDIKPQNILLKGEVVKMTDFGTARQNQNEDLTDVQGTFRYMAPEVYKGEPHSRSCDIWSLGCLTAELLGYPLKFMERRFSYMLGEMTDVPIPPQLKGEARDFVVKCLQVNPNQRIQTTMLSMHPFLSSGTEVQALLHFSDAHNRPGKRTSIASKMSAFSISSQSTANRLPAKRM